MAPQEVKSHFLPYIFSENEIRLLLNQTQRLKGAPFRPQTYRTLLLCLYCTGLRFGEALRLSLADVDLHQASFFIQSSKGRSRLVPFGHDLAGELEAYMHSRKRHGLLDSTAQLFVHNDGRPLPVRTASDTLVRMFRQTGLKPATGRIGPRPYDFRHTYAVHRLTRWYTEGADIQAQLPWLSAYMGHYDLLGTEVYLRATPELLSMASDRFHKRLQERRRR